MRTDQIRKCSLPQTRLEHWSSTWKYGRAGSLGTGSTLIWVHADGLNLALTSSPYFHGSTVINSGTTTWTINMRTTPINRIFAYLHTVSGYAVFFGFRGQSKFRLAPAARLNRRHRPVLPHLRIYVADSYYTTFSPQTGEIRVEPRIVF